MPEELKQLEINSQTDLSVAKRYDTETPKDQQIKELYALLDGQKIGLLIHIGMALVSSPLC